MTDRKRLAAWSLELDDASFGQALAALGALHVAIRHSYYRRSELQQLLAQPGSAQEQIQWVSRVIASARSDDAILAWQMPISPILEDFPTASVLANSWGRFLNESPWGTRLAVISRQSGLRGLLPLLKIIQQPEIGVGSVFVADAFASDGRIDWQLPFHFSVLADDPRAEAFSEFQANWRQPWPYRFTVANRAQPRLEVLVFSGSLVQTAARLLSKGSPSRAALAVVLGGMDAGQQETETLLRLIAREVSAEGVVCITPTESSSSDWAMDALVRLGDELTHNRPLDMALGQIFGQNAAAFLSRDLVRISHLARVVDLLEKRLEALPEGAALEVTERSMGQLMTYSAIVDSLEIVAPRDAREVPRAAAHMSGPVRSVSPRMLARNIAKSKESYRYYRESDEASSLTEVTNELKALEAKQAADKPETRFVQYNFWHKVDGRLVEERQRLVVGTPVMLQVRIGPPDASWQVAPEVFPTNELPPNRRRHRLQLVFHEPTQLDSPMVGELMLPRSGPSKVAEFVFTPRERAAFQGRITVLHRGRVLQTVLIHAQVMLPSEHVNNEQAITQQIEARVREHWSDLGSRKRFDASFVLNHTVDQRPLLTGVSGKRAWATDLSGIKEPIDSINQLLSDVAHSVDDYSKGLTKGDNLLLFIKLARLGSDLYSVLVSDHLQQLRSGGMDVEEATHIQIISTRADAVVPFEFIYQYEPPDDDNGVKFCPNALQALKAGTCPGNCDGQKEPRRHVCPMGFWSLRKVIERHIYSPVIGKPNDAEVIVQAEPAGDRVRLQFDRPALVGYSQEVKPREMSPVIRALKARLKGPVQVAKNWNEWKKNITGSRPTLLVVFPHNTGDKQDIALEIGGVEFKTLRLPREYVHVEGPYPLVMLLGCDVASTAQQYANHIRYFRQAGAAAVVSTIATVFGPHAVKVGQKLLESLLEIHEQSTKDALAGKVPSPGKEPCLGEAMREAKRQALLESLPMALCIVAFGDADWRL
jgi:hypothetical protein